MLKQLTQKPLLIALLAATAGFATNASAMEDIKVDPAMKAHIPYVIDARGVVARSANGLCWRTGYWTPAYAASIPEVGCACDKDLLPKNLRQHLRPLPRSPLPRRSPCRLTPCSISTRPRCVRKAKPRSMTQSAS
jgi:OOP family OmpA-OmpF porin